MVCERILCSGQALLAGMCLLRTAISHAAPSAGPTMVTSMADAARERLQEAEQNFETGRFSEAAQAVDPLLASESDLEPSLRARAFLLKARLSVAFERRDEMRYWLERLTLLDEGIVPDPVRDPPELMESWRRAMERRKREAAAAATPAPGKATEAPAHKTPFSELGQIDNRLRRDARFWVGLLPFGVGHFTQGLVWEGATFAATETSLVLLTSGFIDSTQKKAMNVNGPWDDKVGDHTAFEGDKETAFTTMGFMGFLGLWGYELHSLLPELARANPTGAEATRFALSFAPFGAAQMKNGEGLKAAGFASAELTFLALSATLPREAQRSWSRFFLFGSFVGGAIDGWINHDWNRKVTSSDVWRVGLGVQRGMPVLRVSMATP